MVKALEIRWHGRGGQGAKTAALFVASVALKEGKYSQGFPEYGPERMGAPVAGYTRISEEPIRTHADIEAPDVVVVLDPTLIDVVDVTEGLKDDGILIVNTGTSPDEIRKRLSFDGENVYTVDATHISIDTIGRNIPNTPMIGALVKATDVVQLDAVLAEIDEKFSHKLKPEMVEGNKTAVRRAYQEVKAA